MTKTQRSNGGLTRVKLAGAFNYSEASASSICCSVTWTGRAMEPNTRYPPTYADCTFVADWWLLFLAAPAPVRARRPGVWLEAGFFAAEAFFDIGSILSNRPE